MTGRGQTNALTRATAILATLFFLTSLILAVLASSNRQPRSILDGARPASGTTAPTAPTAPAPGGGSGGVLDELRRLQGDAPAAPSQPQAPTSR